MNLTSAQRFEMTKMALAEIDLLGLAWVAIVEHPVCGHLVPCVHYDTRDEDYVFKALRLSHPDWPKGVEMFSNEGPCIDCLKGLNDGSTTG